MAPNSMVLCFVLNLECKKQPVFSKAHVNESVNRSKLKTQFGIA